MSERDEPANSEAFAWKPEYTHEELDEWKLNELVHDSRFDHDKVRFVFAEGTLRIEFEQIDYSDLKRVGFRLLWIKYEAAMLRITLIISGVARMELTDPEALGSNSVGNVVINDDEICFEGHNGFLRASGTALRLSASVVKDPDWAWPYVVGFWGDGNGAPYLKKENAPDSRG